MYIEEQAKINLNGVPQFVSIRAEKEHAPLLVYLHGGPGDAPESPIINLTVKLRLTFF